MAGSANKTRAHSPQPLLAAVEGEPTTLPQTMAEPSRKARAHSPQPLLATDEGNPTPLPKIMAGSSRKTRTYSLQPQPAARRRQRTPPPKKEPWEFGSREMLEHPLKTLWKYHGGWIKERELLWDQWHHGSLFRHMKVMRDDEGKIIGEADQGLIIAGSGADNKLLGLKLTAWDDDVTFLTVKSLAKDKEAVFVAESEARVPAWMQKHHSELLVFYDHEQLTGAYIAKLVCAESSFEDHYQLLKKKPERGEIDWGLWEKAKKAGVRLRRDEATAAKASASKHTSNASKYVGPGSMSLYGAELFRNNETSEAAQEKHHGRLVLTGSTGKAQKGRGVATALGGMDLEDSVPDDQAASGTAKEGGSKFGVIKEGPASSKMKNSAQGHQASSGTAQDVGASSDKGGRKRKHFEAHEGGGRNGEAQVEESMAKKSRTEDYSEDYSVDYSVSHIEAGFSSMYTEAETKRNRRLGAW